MIRTPIERRAFIRALGLGAGYSMIAPFLDAQLAHAQGDAVHDRPKILANFAPVFGWSVLGKTDANGQPYRIYEPSSATLTPKSLPEIFSPLASYSDRMMIVSGLSRQGFGNFHGSMNLGTGFPSKGSGPSYDYLLARQISKDLPIDLLSWRLGYHSDILSYGANRRSIPCFDRLGDMYRSLFGQAGTPGLEQQLKGQSVIMDSLRADLNKTRRQLAGTEIAAFDEYETSLRQLTSRIERSLTIECPAYTVAQKPEPDVKVGSYANYQWAQRSYMDMALLAIQCGMTRAVSFFPISGQDDGRRYSYVPHANNRQKDSSTFHDGVCHSHHGEVHNPTGHPAMVRHHQFGADSLRYFFDGLSRIKLEDGTPADQTAVGIWHNHGGAWHHNIGKAVAEQNHVAVVIDGTRKTFKTGRHIDLPWDDSTHHAQFFQTIMEGFGLPSDGFGHKQYARGPLDMLLSDNALRHVRADRKSRLEAASKAL